MIPWLRLCKRHRMAVKVHEQCPLCEREKRKREREERGKGR